MSKLVVDASVATKWLVTETLTDEALAILGSDNELVAPNLFPIEIGNVLWNGFASLGGRDKVPSHCRCLKALCPHGCQSLRA